MVIEVQKHALIWVILVGYSTMLIATLTVTLANEAKRYDFGCSMCAT